MVTSLGLPISLSFKSKWGSKYSSGVRAVGLLVEANSVVRSWGKGQLSDCPQGRLPPRPLAESRRRATAGLGGQSRKTHLLGSVFVLNGAQEGLQGVSVS